MTNDQLFEAYDSELVLRNQSKKGLYEARRVLGQFRGFLRPFPPTPELGKQFLSRFADCKPATKYRYTQILTAFFDWYGEKLGVKVRVPRKLPEYIDDKEINALLEAIASRATHKKNAPRDSLLVELALHTDMRQSELANLGIGDIHLDQGILIVRNGKGGKDGVVPLNATISARLRGYITPDMPPQQKLFGLKPSSISGKIERFTRKAGVKIHVHTLRHVFGTRLIERGANPEAVRQLMRYERLDTTQRYISLAAKGLKEAVDLLDNPPQKTSEKTEPSQKVDAFRHRMSWETGQNQPTSSQELEKILAKATVLPPGHPMLTSY